MPDRRPLALAATFVLAATALGACGSAATHPRAASTGAVGTNPTPPIGVPPVAHAPAPPSARTVPDGLTALRNLLAHEMTLAGPGAGAVFEDLNDRHVLFAWNPSVEREPASVEKLFTSIAVLHDLGPTARLTTTLLGRGSLRRGIWHGDLYLRGAGDPSFGAASFNAQFEGGEGTTDDALVSELRALGIRRVTGRLIGDESLFDTRRGSPATDDQPDIVDLGGELSGLAFDHGFTGVSATPPGDRARPRRRGPVLAPGAYAASMVAAALRAAHISVHASPRTGVTPPDARALAAVRSPPMSTILGLMNRPSDDLYAETLLKLLGAREAGAGSTDAGAGVVRGVLGAEGVHPTIVDGSGLSRRDRASPQQVVAALRAVANTGNGQVLRATLPVPGRSGTLSFRMGGTLASRRCEAKTGSLTGVLNLAGYCRVANGDLVAFAIFMDGPQTYAQRTEQDSMVITLARTDPNGA